MQKILLAVDGSESCNKAIDKAKELAEGVNAEVTIITVFEEAFSIQHSPSKQYVDKKISEMEKVKEARVDIIEKCANNFKDDAKINTITKKGNPAKQICKEAKSGNYDFVLVADKGKSAIKDFFLGSTAEKVVRYCENTVMVVK